MICYFFLLCKFSLSCYKGTEQSKTEIHCIYGLSSTDMAPALALQVYLGSAGALDVEGKELPRLVYISREKQPGYPHHKKAGAMNALVRTKT